MHLEFEPDEVGQDGRAARLRLDGGVPLAWFGADDGEAMRRDGEYRGRRMSGGGIADGRVWGVEGRDAKGWGWEARAVWRWRRDLRDDVGACRDNGYQLDTVSVIGKERDQLLPFHTDRASSAFVGFMAACDGSSLWIISLLLLEDPRMLRLVKPRTLSAVSLYAKPPTGKLGPECFAFNPLCVGK